jgi:N-acyl-D-aspartate/D-glutamate deacylase
MARYDLMIRGATIVDGAGADPFEGDIAVAEGKIAAVGKGLAGAGAEEIDARGLLATPGFVDVHTHYDGQATWDQRLEPSSWHGVTSVVMGNCGVGFAPCRAADRDTLVRLMEGVEDIPGTALHEGLPWNWETFPDYLNVLDAMARDIDVAAYLPHGALRVYAMGDRAVRREAASADDRETMARLTDEAMRAGALGFATSRAIVHKSSDGQLTPMYRAERDEVLAITGALKGRGVVQWVTDFQPFDAEWGLFLAASASGQGGATFSLVQGPGAPFGFRKILAAVDDANAHGHRIVPQVLSRPVGVLMGLEATIHPFVTKPSYEAIAHLPLAERVAAMRDPVLKAKIIAEPAGEFHAILAFFDHAREKMFPMGAEPDYAPRREDSVAARAAAAGRDADDWLYDWLLEDGGRALIYVPLYNFATGDLSGLSELLRHKDTIFGLADGGAHVGTICDASSTTYMLTRWVRETGELPVAEAVRLMTRAPCETVGLMDRGAIRPGLKADLNVIDLDRLAVARPEIAYDLPAGGKRFMQRAEGYVATIVSGVPIMRDGERTGALPGRLIRGRQTA